MKKKLLLLSFVVISAIMLYQCRSNHSFRTTIHTSFNDKEFVVYLDKDSGNIQFKNETFNLNCIWKKRKDKMLKIVVDEFTILLEKLK